MQPNIEFYFRRHSTSKVFPLRRDGEEIGDNEIIVVGNTHPSGRGMNGNVYDANGIAPTLTTNKGEGNKIAVQEIIQVGNFMPRENRDNPNQGRVYDPQGIAPTLNKMEGGGRQPHILVSEAEQENVDVYDFYNHKFREDGICGTLTASGNTSSLRCGSFGIVTKEQEVCAVLTPDREEKRQNGRRFKENGEPMFTLTTQDVHGVMIYQKPRGKNEGGLHEEAPTLTKNSYEQNNLLVEGIPIKNATKQWYDVANEGDSINLQFLESDTRRGRVQKGIAGTLDTSCNQGVLVKDEVVVAEDMIPDFIPGPDDINRTLRKGGHNTPTAKHNHEIIYDSIRIRRLTPKECWRLQDIPDEITDKVIAAGISDTQMYRGAGDATTRKVIYEIAKGLK